MAESKTEKKVQEEKPATEAQFKLIRDLMSELGHAILPEKWEGKVLNRVQASEVVHYLKEQKVRDQALRAANAKASQFDKIGFGMVYKLVWRAALEAPHATKLGQHGFIEMVIGEYEVFKDAQKACRQHVEDGGLK